MKQDIKMHYKTTLKKKEKILKKKSFRQDTELLLKKERLFLRKISLKKSLD